MANVFDITNLAGTLASAKDKALALAGEFGLNDALKGRVLPVLPPYPLGRDIKISGGLSYQGIPIEIGDTNNEVSIFGTPMCFPLKIKPSSAPITDFWLLPVEPMITLSGGNNIVRRNVSKGSLRGTVKERWSQDDYTINIEGIFTRVDDWTFPEEDAKKLIGMLESGDTLDVSCEFLEMLHIDRMSVEKWDLPFTKGEENQAYRISGYSDDNWALLLNADGTAALKNS